MEVNLAIAGHGHQFRSLRRGAIGASQEWPENRGIQTFLAIDNGGDLHPNWIGIGKPAGVDARGAEFEGEKVGSVGAAGDGEIRLVQRGVDCGEKGGVVGSDALQAFIIEFHIELADAAWIFPKNSNWP